MSTSDSSVIQVSIICITLMIAAFMFITFMPTKDDTKTSVYSHSNKSNIIYEDTKTVMSSSAGTVVSESSSTGNLDSNWAEHGYHPYAYVKDFPISDIPELSGYKMTYTQTAHWHQHNCGDTDTCPIGKDTQGYRGNSCGWVSMCDFLYAASNNNMSFDEWNKIKVTGFPGHPDWSSTSACVTKTWGYFNLPGWEKSVTGDTDMTALKELFDKGGVVIFSATGTAGASKYTYNHHIVMAVGYVSKDGIPTHLIVVDCSQGNTTSSYIKSSGTALTAGQYLTFVKLEKIANPLKGSNGFLKIWPTNPPTSKNTLNTQESISEKGSLSIDKVYNQYTDLNLSTGCESVAITMTAQVVGLKDFDTKTFISSYMSTEPKTGDPYRGQLGGFQDGGLGCFPPAIVSAVNKYLPNLSNGSSYVAIDTTGKSLDELYNLYIKKNIPVAIWSTIKNDPSKRKESSNTYQHNGKSFKWISGEHCMTFLGYENDKVIVADPDEGKVMEYDKNTFEQEFNTRGKMSVVIQKK